METRDLAGHACSPGLRLEILGRVPFFAHLDGEDLARVDARFVERGFVPHETVFTAGDPATEVHVVATGVLRALRHTPQGRDVLMDVLVPGDVYGGLPTLGHDRHLDTVTAHTACCVLAAGADDMRGILEGRPGVALRVLDHVAARLHESHERIRHLSASPVGARLAAVLVRLAAKLGRYEERGAGGTGVDLPLSQRDLAEMAGTTLESVNRALRPLRADGLVRTARGRVTVLDPAGLAARAELDET